MVSETGAYLTKFGTLCKTRDEAEKTEAEETQNQFAKDLVKILIPYDISGNYEREQANSTYQKGLFIYQNAGIIKILLNKYDF